MYKNFLGKISVLDRNFLTKDQCQHIKKEILANQSLWQNLPGLNLTYFPFGFYLIKKEAFKLDGYIKSVREYRPIMYDLFGSYYEKIKQELEQRLQIDLQFEEKMHYPGFHIVNKQTKLNFHRDLFRNHFGLYDGVDFAKCKILSVIVPISLPESGSGLLIRHRDLEGRSTPEYDEELDYTIGMLACWDGNIVHSIKPFAPSSESDYRITMQMHVLIVDDSRGFLFW